MVLRTIRLFYPKRVFSLFFPFPQFLLVIHTHSRHTNSTRVGLLFSLPVRVPSIHANKFNTFVLSVYSSNFLCDSFQLCRTASLVVFWCLFNFFPISLIDGVWFGERRVGCSCAFEIFHLFCYSTSVFRIIRFKAVMPSNICSQYRKLKRSSRNYSPLSSNSSLSKLEPIMEEIPSTKDGQPEAVVEAPMKRQRSSRRSLKSQKTADVLQNVTLEEIFFKENPFRVCGYMRVS